MAVIQDVLKNMTLFVDGRGYAGQVKEITLPKLVTKTEELRAGGMDAPVKIEMGMDPMDLEFSLISVSGDILKSWGLAPGNTLPLTVRGSLVSEDATEKPVTISMRGHIDEVDLGTWKPGEAAELKAKVSLRSYKFEHNGELIHDVNPEEMRRVINGTDQLAQTRINLGL